MKIKFHGYLKKLCPKEFYEIEANTPAEAIRGLTNQMKQLIRVSGNRWRCRVKECTTHDSLYSHHDGLEELNIYPEYAPAGGGGSGLGMFLIGALIVVLAVVAWFALPAVLGVAMTATTAAGATVMTTAGTLTLAAGMMGAGIMLGGLAAMLMPVPKVDNQDSPPPSKYFGAGQNTTSIGTRIAVCYGKYKHYGQLVSVQSQSGDR
jgi:predicted phage tail protein